MLRADAREIARKKIQLIVGDHQRLVGEEVHRIRSSMGANPNGRSLVQAAEVCERDASARAEESWREMHRVAISTGTRFSAELRGQLAGLFDEACTFGDLPDRPNKVAQALGMNAPAFDEIKREIVSAIERARAWTYSEIDLFVASLDVETAQAMPLNIHLYNPVVGAIQTGAAASAVVSQHQGQDIQSVADALASLLAAVQASGVVSAPDKAEIAAVVDEARQEVLKPVPNRSRLRGLMAGVGAILSRAHDVKDVFEAAKAALKLFNVDVPD